MLWMTWGQAGGQGTSGPGQSALTSHGARELTKTHRDPGHNPDWRYLQGQQVTLQAVSNEDGVGTEHAQQDSLDVPQRDACVRKVSLCYPGKPGGSGADGTMA